MGIKKIKKLLTIDELNNKIKFSDQLIKQKKSFDNELTKILLGEIEKFIIIVGPCSAHDPLATLDYFERLIKFCKPFRKKLFIIGRVYTTKSRTDSQSYKGLLHNPDSIRKNDMYSGLIAQRKLLIDVLNLGIPIADEIIYPQNMKYIKNILSYATIGARSVESQYIRLYASSLDIPIGIKNPTNGSINTAFKTLHAVQNSQRFIFDGYELESSGNKLAHIILRGYFSYAKSFPNYHYENLIQVINMFENLSLTPQIIIDTNHDNSAKQYHQQIRIAKEILFNINQSEQIKKAVKGIMIESFIENGNQLDNKIYGKSITDPCLGLDKTCELIQYIAENLK